MKDIIDQIIEDSESFLDKQGEGGYEHIEVAMIFNLRKMSLQQKIDLYSYIQEGRVSGNLLDEELEINTEHWREANFSLANVILDEQLKLINTHNLENYWIVCGYGKYNGELYRYLKFQQFDDDLFRVVDDPNL